VYYNRDSLQRITDIISVNGADSSILRVWYADASSGKVAYTKARSTNQGAAYQDSSVYAYNSKGQVTRITLYNLSQAPYLIDDYYSYAYDEKGNLKQLQRYLPDGSGNFVMNLGFDFEYDDKINPLFSNPAMKYIIH
jgi:hypothetical protein